MRFKLSNQFRRKMEFLKNLKFKQDMIVPDPEELRVLSRGLPAQFQANKDIILLTNSPDILNVQ